MRCPTSGSRSHTELQGTGVRTPAGEHVTIVEALEPTRPFEEFVAAVKAAARRLKAEGVEE